MKIIIKKRRILNGILSVFLLLVIGEFALRLCAGGLEWESLVEQDALKDIRMSPVFGWEQRAGIPGDIGAQRSEGPSVLILGAAHGEGCDREKQKAFLLSGGDRPQEKTFAGVLQAMLPGVRVTDLSARGHSSYQAYKTLVLRGLATNPSLVIVNCSYYDRCAVSAAGCADSDSAYRRMYIAYLCKRLYLFRLLGWLLDGTGDLSLLVPRVSPENYRANLTRIAEALRAGNVPLVFLRCPENPRYFSSLMKGVACLQQKQYGSATDHFRRAAREGRASSLLARKYLPELFTRVGLAEEAATSKEIELGKPYYRYGNMPLFPFESYDEVMADVARECGVDVFDLGAVLDKDQRCRMVDDGGQVKKAGYEQCAEHLRDMITQYIFPENGDRGQAL